MSAKARFLKKLQDAQPHSDTFENKSQADIAQFWQRMSQLQENMEGWLTDTGIKIEQTTVSLMELLAGGKAFMVPGIVLRHENRAVKFTPVFLYGQGVTGCVEASLCVENRVTPLCRLFMRTSDHTEWTWSPSGLSTGPRRVFCEEAFYDMVEGLLP